MLQSHERATLFAEQSICGKSGAAYKWIAAFEADRKFAVGWIGALRPSRQLLRSFLRMRNLLILSKDYLMLRSACRARLEARTTEMQPIPDSLFSRDDDE